MQPHWERGSVPTGTPPHPDGNTGSPGQEALAAGAAGGNPLRAQAPTQGTNPVTSPLGPHRVPRGHEVCPGECTGRRSAGSHPGTVPVELVQPEGWRPAFQLTDRAGPGRPGPNPQVPSTQGGTEAPVRPAPHAQVCAPWAEGLQEGKPGWQTAGVQ